MSQLDEKIALYTGEMTSIGLDFDPVLLANITKALGPVIYNEDSSRVSCSDNEEMARVKNNFLVGKLGLTDGPELDAAMKEVCEQLGSSNRNKFRAMFYYLLVVKFNKQDQFA